MPYFLVSRTDRIDYDEYDAFVVKAKNEEEALKFCYDPMYDDLDDRYASMRVQNGDFNADNVTIERLDGKRHNGPVLCSFNAG